MPFSRSLIMHAAAFCVIVAPGPCTIIMLAKLGPSQPTVWSKLILTLEHHLVNALPF